MTVFLPCPCRPIVVFVRLGALPVQLLRVGCVACLPFIHHVILDGLAVATHQARLLLEDKAAILERCIMFERGWEETFASTGSFRLTVLVRIASRVICGVYARLGVLFSDRVGGPRLRVEILLARGDFSCFLLSSASRLLA